MADLSSLSDAQAILLACELCAAGNVNPLPRLHQQFPTSLTTERLFRIILSFLPETTPPSHYTPILDDIDRNELSETSSGPIDVSAIKEVKEPEARTRVRRLRLLPLKYRSGESIDDLLTEFLIHRAHKIDEETGLQTFILDLLLPFYDRSEILRRYLVSLILPLLRANYEYYPDREEKLSLHVFDSLDTATSINLLLSMAASNATAIDLAQNLRGLAGPWITGRAESKRRKLSHEDSTTEVKDIACNASEDWQVVNEWLLSRSLVEFENVARGIIDWDGPEDVDSGGYLPGDESPDEIDRLRRSYGQAALAIVYATDLGRGSLESSFQIASKVENLLGLDSNLHINFDSEQLPVFDVDVDTLSTASKALLLQNALLKPNNSLTVPTPQSVGFLQVLLVSLRVLCSFGYNTSCRSAATVCLQNGEEAQASEMHGVINMIVKQAKPGLDWRRIREQILWLQDWRSGSHNTLDQGKAEYHGLFWRVSRTAVETEILRAMITAGEYQVATEIYTGANSPLDSTQVEVAAVETIISFYDTASNGNKTRGKMKRAVDTLKAFQSQFPNAKSLRELAALISATHALSFYSLTLQHGVPFQPVSIRVHGDPLSLVEKVLEQNSKSYTKLDDLVSIGRDFIAAGLPLQLPGDDESRWWKTGRNSKLSQEQKSLLAEKRIVSMAVSSALASDDFGTAYSYILTRLTPPSLTANSSSSAHNSTSPIEDNISWRAAYNAGRHRSIASPAADHTQLTAQISVLSQRLELLSLALVLAPTADPLPEILGAWRRCDEELSTLRDQENQEAEEWDQKGDTATTTTVPGGFGPSDRELDAFETERQQTRRARARHNNNNNKHNNYHMRSGSFEEAPMGLFDVARGAARAFSKNIPLQTRSRPASIISPAGGEQFSDGSSSDFLSRSTELDAAAATAEDRVRKRDMVSNMVTGGLASGIGWVLGAQPVNNNNDDTR
ncbi:Sister chromatid cohesion protein PDS5 [Talaromyces islandicus]|uniref:Sister chromatid cohesion protein PDS5 n=1 Tax=Talaromyces islandicus TaxID=28573 RepID=A0A0U1LR02_TALIS|nr:Sister chromatid cohesion protein PDS5 [Talaromyces islandicus]